MSDGLCTLREAELHLPHSTSISLTPNASMTDQGPVRPPAEEKTPQQYTERRAGERESSEEDFFPIIPCFPFLSNPQDLLFPSFHLLPLSLAFRLFSFLQTRISSAGHQHSFSTGSLCFDIPTPPSVLYNSVPSKQNQQYKMVTQNFTSPYPQNCLLVILYI